MPFSPSLAFELHPSGAFRKSCNQTQKELPNVLLACAQARVGELGRERNSCFIHVAGNVLVPEGMRVERWVAGQMGRGAVRGSEGGGGELLSLMAPKGFEIVIFLSVTQESFALQSESPLKGLCQRVI